ncbi:MAG: MFS transporter [Woeseiaceae bacterium]|nr:MFS transporter [Woeseiaceae bacterium]
MSDARTIRGPLGRLAAMLGIEAREFAAVAWSFVYFFCLLSAYYMLRSVREAMAIVGGTENIPWLFTGTFVVMLLATPVFGWVASRFPRKQFLPWVYYFFVLNILLFYAAFTLVQVRELSPVWVSRAFFVWLSVFNLFVVSVFWSFMADIWSKEQSRRLFGLISAGGSTGALVGPLITSVLVVPIGFRNLLPLSALLLAFAVVCVYRLRHLAVGRVDERGAARGDEPIGGRALAGIRLVATSPYLGAIAGALVIANFLGVATYMYMAQLVDQTFPDTDRHTQVFAILDAITNALSFIGQLVVVKYSVRRLGVGMTLAVLPIVSVLGFAVLAMQPVFVVIAALQVVRRSITFGLSKPTSDMLYSVVSPEARYKAKNFVETAIYRGGDLFATWTIRFIGGIGLAGVAAVCVPLAILWTVLALRIGRGYDRRDEALTRGETA